MPVEYIKTIVIYPQIIVQNMLICGEILKWPSTIYMCKEVMFLARKLDAQNLSYNKTLYKICLEEISLLLPNFKEPERLIMGIIGILFKAIVHIPEKLFQLLLGKRGVKLYIKQLLALTKQQLFEVMLCKAVLACLCYITWVV